MSVGILVGHFEPLHLGHLQDINRAAGQCDTLHIVILPKVQTGKFRPSLQDKARWLQVACQHFDFIKIHTKDSLNLPDESSWAYDDAMRRSELTKENINKIKDVLNIDDVILVFVNELTDVCQNGVDIAVKLPNHDVDGAKIAENPVRYFEKIAPSAKADYVQTVCVVGGESSGKTTLVHKLANHYGASLALEMGRLYTHSDLGGTEIGLQYSDYLAIATNHAQAILEAKKHATAPVVFVDTDFATTQAFCEEYEGRTHPVVAAFADEMRMDFTVYLDNNVKWVADGMRRLGDDRQRSRFASRLLEVLSRHDIKPFIIDDDDYHTRYIQAVDFIEKNIFINSKNME